jgi:hypothetical protein
MSDKKNDLKKDIKPKKSNVIDLTKRIAPKKDASGFAGLKVRWDLERAKVAVSTSLLSVVLLVTLANNSTFKTIDIGVSKTDLASVSTETVGPGRGIASVPTGTSDSEDEMVKKLSLKELKEEAVGRKPSSVESFAFGYLEGKYIVRHQNGKVREVEFSSQGSPDDRPKSIESRQDFLSQNRELLPSGFDKAIRVGSNQVADKLTENYELLNTSSMPVAKVQFELDAAGRLLAMRIDRTQLTP